MDQEKSNFENKSRPISLSLEIFRMPDTQVNSYALNNNDINYHFTLPHYKSVVDKRRASCWRLITIDESKGQKGLVKYKRSLDGSAVLLDTKAITIVNPWPCLIDEVKVAEEFNDCKCQLEMELMLLKNNDSSNVEVCGIIMNDSKRRRGDVQAPILSVGAANFVDEHPEVGSGVGTNFADEVGNGEGKKNSIDDFQFIDADDEQCTVLIPLIRPILFRQQVYAIPIFYNLIEEQITQQKHTEKCYCAQLSIPINSYKLHYEAIQLIIISKKSNTSTVYVNIDNLIISEIKMRKIIKQINPILHQTYFVRGKYATVLYTVSRVSYSELSVIDFDGDILENSGSDISAEFYKQNKMAVEHELTKSMNESDDITEKWGVLKVMCSERQDLLPNKLNGKNLYRLSGNDLDSTFKNDIDVRTKCENKSYKFLPILHDHLDVEKQHDTDFAQAPYEDNLMVEDNGVILDESKQLIDKISHKLNEYTNDWIKTDQHQRESLKPSNAFDDAGDDLLNHDGFDNANDQYQSDNLSSSDVSEVVNDELQSTYGFNGINDQNVSNGPQLSDVNDRMNAEFMRINVSEDEVDQNQTKGLQSSDNYAGVIMLDDVLTNDQQKYEKPDGTFDKSDTRLFVSGNEEGQVGHQRGEMLLDHVSGEIFNSDNVIGLQKQNAIITEQYLFKDASKDKNDKLVRTDTPSIYSVDPHMNAKMSIDNRPIESKAANPYSHSIDYDHIISQKTITMPYEQLQSMDKNLINNSTVDTAALAFTYRNLPKKNSDKVDYNVNSALPGNNRLEDVKFYDNNIGQTTFHMPVKKKHISPLESYLRIVIELKYRQLLIYKGRAIIFALMKLKIKKLIYATVKLGRTVSVIIARKSISIGKSDLAKCQSIKSNRPMKADAVSIDANRKQITLLNSMKQQTPKKFNQKEHQVTQGGQNKFGNYHFISSQGLMDTRKQYAYSRPIKSGNIGNLSNKSGAKEISSKLKTISSKRQENNRKIRKDPHDLPKFFKLDNGCQEIQTSVRAASICRQF